MSEASEFLDNFCLIMPDCYKKRPVGQVVLRMSPEKRALLATLKSEDLQNVRPDSCWLYNLQGKGRWGTRK